MINFLISALKGMKVSKDTSGWRLYMMKPYYVIIHKRE